MPATRRWIPTSTNGNLRTQNFMAMSAFRWMVLEPPRDRRHDHQPDLPRHPDPSPKAAHRRHVESSNAGSSRCSTDFGDLRKEDAAELRTSTRVFAANIWVNTFWGGLCPAWSTPSAWDKVMFGSDYPPGGLSPNQRASGTPRRGMDVSAPTTSWATAPPLWACRSPALIRQVNPPVAASGEPEA